METQIWTRSKSSCSRSVFPLFICSSGRCEQAELYSNTHSSHLCWHNCNIYCYNHPKKTALVPSFPPLHCSSVMSDFIVLVMQCAVSAVLPLYIVLCILYPYIVFWYILQILQSKKFLFLPSSQFFNAAEVDCLYNLSYSCMCLAN